MISKDLYKAAKLLYSDAVVAVPTETVYGLAGNIYSATAIQKIFEIKRRPKRNPLIVHIGSPDLVEKIASEIPLKAKQLMDTFWPGPLTVVLPKQSSVPDLVTGGKDTVAIRMPNHPDTLKLLRLLPFPIAAPSANPFGSISPTSAQHVANYFDETIPMILDGGSCENGIESTIIGFEKDVPVLYRLGSLSVEALEETIGPIRVRNFEENQPMAPGMMLRHYAPATLTITANDIEEAITCYSGKKVGLLLFSDPIKDETVFHQEIVSVSRDLNEAASNLYAAMHRLDAMDLDVIIAQQFPDNYLGRAINDRLLRAGATFNSSIMQ